jgi:hypothetical protein
LLKYVSIFFGGTGKKGKREMVYVYAYIYKNNENENDIITVSIFFGRVGININIILFSLFPCLNVFILLCLFMNRMSLYYFVYRRQGKREKGRWFMFIPISIKIMKMKMISLPFPFFFRACIEIRYIYFFPFFPVNTSAISFSIVVKKKKG